MNSNVRHTGVIVKSRDTHKSKHTVQKIPLTKKIQFKNLIIDCNHSNNMKYILHSSPNQNSNLESVNVKQYDFGKILQREEKMVVILSLVTFVLSKFC